MTHHQLPPGPRGRLRCSMRLARDVVDGLHQWRAEHGDTFSLPLMIGDWVVTCDPERVRQIFATRDLDTFAAAAPEATDLLLGRHSVIRQAGQQHTRDRKLMTPPLHGERMRAWAETIAQIARDTCARSALDQPTRALDLTQHMTLDVILRVVFGVRDLEKLERFHAVVHDWARSFNPILIFMSALQRDLWGLSPYARYRVHCEQLDGMLREQIAATHAIDGSGDDMLSMLAAARYEDGERMSDDKLLHNLRTMLFAGHETSAIVLAWALELLHRHPQVLARLRAELDELGADIEPDALARLPYLGAVIDESMRIRPPAVDMMRTLERFLEETPPPWVFAPFGGGSRRCLGATFARYEVEIVLGTLLREFDFELLGEPATLQRGKTLLEPSNGVPLRARARPQPSNAA